MVRAVVDYDQGCKAKANEPGKEGDRSGGEWRMESRRWHGLESDAKVNAWSPAGVQ